jgi:hypothetical protein
MWVRNDGVIGRPLMSNVSAGARRGLAFVFVMQGWGSNLGAERGAKESEDLHHARDG